MIPSLFPGPGAGFALFQRAGRLLLVWVQQPGLQEQPVSMSVQSTRTLELACALYSSSDLEPQTPLKYGMIHSLDAPLT